MNYARIEQNTVAQVLRVSPFSIFGDSFAGQFQPCGDDVAVGWLWGGETFAAPPAAPVSVPQSVTRRQAKQALILSGLIAGVQPAIDAIPDATQRALIQCEWDDSQEFERHRPALIALGAALGLDSAQLDALFVTASTL